MVYVDLLDPSRDSNEPAFFTRNCVESPYDHGQLVSICNRYDPSNPNHPATQILRKCLVRAHEDRNVTYDELIDLTRRIISN